MNMLILQLIDSLQNRITVTYSQVTFEF